MKITLDSKILKEHGVNMQEFSVILYYLSGGTGILNKAYCHNLYERGFLRKTETGYELNPIKKNNIRTWIIESTNSKSTLERLAKIAEAMRNEYPDGKKSGKYYLKDSVKVITQRLAIFIKKYGDFDDGQFINATREYVQSFNGNYEYIQLLKYFIYKKESTGEENSQLASYIENAGKEGSTRDRDWTSKLV